MCCLVVGLIGNIILSIVGVISLIRVQVISVSFWPLIIICSVLITPIIIRLYMIFLIGEILNRPLKCIDAFANA